MNEWTKRTLFWLHKIDHTCRLAFQQRITTQNIHDPTDTVARPVADRDVSKAQHGLVQCPRDCVAGISHCTINRSENKHVIDMTADSKRSTQNDALWSVNSTSRSAGRSWPSTASTSCSTLPLFVMLLPSRAPKSDGGRELVDERHRLGRFVPPRCARRTTKAAARAVAAGLM